MSKETQMTQMTQRSNWESNIDFERISRDCQNGIDIYSKRSNGLTEEWDVNYKFFYDPKFKSCSVRDWVLSGGIIPEPTLSKKYPDLKFMVELNKKNEEEWRSTSQSH